LDVPASSSDADRRLEEAPEERVADRSPMAAEAGGLSERAARHASNTRIVTPTVSVLQRLREIWLSRELLIYLVRTEIKVKYKNSVLGLVWSMVAPAMTLAIYFFVFQVILNNKQPNFVIFLFAGLLLWNLFSLGVQTGTGVVVNNAAIVKKVSFPREILSLAAVGSACVFFAFQTIVLVVVMVLLHHSPDWSYLPVLLLALVTGILLASAIAVLLSSVNVYLRDTQHLIEVILTAWFWACPIVYAYQQYIGDKLGPRGLTWVYFLNPMVPLVLSFQRCIYALQTAYVTTTATVGGKVVHVTTTYHVLPPKGMIWYVGLDLAVLFLSMILFLVAVAIFGRLEGNFAEEL
jgi:ABC-2 type transport system permease protein